MKSPLNCLSFKNVFSTSSSTSSPTERSQKKTKTSAFRRLQALKGYHKQRSRKNLLKEQASNHSTTGENSIEHHRAFRIERNENESNQQPEKVRLPSPALALRAESGGVAVRAALRRRRAGRAPGRRTAGPVAKHLTLERASIGDAVAPPPGNSESNWS